MDFLGILLERGYPKKIILTVTTPFAQSCPPLRLPNPKRCLLGDCPTASESCPKDVLLRTIWGDKHPPVKWNSNAQNFHVCCAAWATWLPARTWPADFGAVPKNICWGSSWPPRKKHPHPKPVGFTDKKTVHDLRMVQHLNGGIRQWLIFKTPAGHLRPHFNNDTPRYRSGCHPKMTKTPGNQNHQRKHRQPSRPSHCHPSAGNLRRG